MGDTAVSAPLARTALGLLLMMPLHQILQRDVVHHAADGLLQLLPDIQRYAGITAGTLVGGILHTGHGDKVAFNQP